MLQCGIGILFLEASHVCWPCSPVRGPPSLRTLLRHGSKAVKSQNAVAEDRPTRRHPPQPLQLSPEREDWQQNSDLLRRLHRTPPGPAGSGSGLGFEVGKRYDLGDEGGPAREMLRALARAGLGVVLLPSEAGGTSGFAHRRDERAPERGVHSARFLLVGTGRLSQILRGDELKPS